MHCELMKKMRESNQNKKGFKDYQGRQQLS